MLLLHIMLLSVEQQLLLKQLLLEFGCLGLGRMHFFLG
jgi:hypothetical protein